MRYEIRFQHDQSLKESHDDLSHAIAIAAAMGNWNRPCNVVDSETGEQMYTGQAYHEATGNI